MAEGTLNPDKRISDYLPDLADSAFGDATVRQLLDMTTALKFSEDYSDPEADVWLHAQAGSPLPGGSATTTTARSWHVACTDRPSTSTPRPRW